MSAGAERTIAAAEAAGTVVSWFADGLTALGWTDIGDGQLRRDVGESFLARVDRDSGRSRIGSGMPLESETRRIQEEWEQVFYAGAPSGWSVVTLFYTVAPAVS
jgi:hypothetical protein